MASAASLDEVIEVHEAYLLSIQRQCFVVPDKLVSSISFCLFWLAAWVYSLILWMVHLLLKWIQPLFNHLVCSQWALIASRISSILGLALDFYSVQLTLTSGGAVSAIKARCEMEVARIEKQFDDCIAFLLRVIFSNLVFSWSTCSLRPCANHLFAWWTYIKVAKQMRSVTMSDTWH